MGGPPDGEMEGTGVRPKKAGGESPCLWNYVAVTSQGALQVLKQKDETLLQLCISEGRLVAMQVDQMGPG